MLAARAPKLESALLATKMAGHDDVCIDGTLIETDRCRTPGPTKGVDLWWSGEHANHGGNIQVVTAPDGWPLWTSEIQWRELVATLREGPWEVIRIMIKTSVQGRSDDPVPFLRQQAVLSRHRDRAERAIEEYGRVRSRRLGTRTRWTELENVPL